MSNSLGTLNGNLIAQKALPLLRAYFPVFDSFTTNFSDEPIHMNQTVYTRIHSVVPLQAFDTTNGYVGQAANITDASVTVNNHSHVSFTFNDTELSSASYNLIQEKSEVLAQSLGLGLMTGVAALFTTGNFPSAPTVQALTGVTRGTIVKANAALNTRNVPNVNRYCIGNSNFVAQLKQDPNLISTLFVPGGLGVSSSTLPRVDGATITDYSALPSTNNIQAVIGSKDSVLLATRVPYDVSSLMSIPGVVQNITDPDTGLTIQSRMFYDGRLGQITISYVIMWGASVGNSNSLQCITTS